MNSVVKYTCASAILALFCVPAQAQSTLTTYKNAPVIYVADPADSYGNKTDTPEGFAGNPYKGSPKAKTSGGNINHATTPSPTATPSTSYATPDR